MSGGKRLFDIVIALALGVVLVPVGLIMALAILMIDGRPVLYLSERMKTPEQGFKLWKFRTMRPQAGDVGVSGGHKADRITRTGHVMRRYRLDEIPQLWNILRGDISFVGPRPPLRRYVEAFPELYRAVLRSRPGVTGLASIVYHRHEAALLARCATPAQTDAVYSRICVPAKARLDLIYQRHQSICYDFDLVFQTIGNLFRRH